MEKKIAFHQVQLKFVPEEDRLLLRINTKEKELLEFFITRRFLKVVWTPLSQVLLSDPAFKAYDEPAQKAVFAFEHEKKMTGASVEKKFEETETTKLMASTPLLLTTAQVLTLPDNMKALGLKDQQGRGITLNSNAPALHFIYRLLLATVPTVGWDFQLQPIETFKPDDQHVTH